MLKISIQVVTVIRNGYNKAFASKKRGLINNSNTEKDAKRQQEENPEVQFSKHLRMFSKKVSSQKIV